MNSTNDKSTSHARCASRSGLLMIGAFIVTACVVSPPARPLADAGASLECGAGSGLYCGQGAALGAPICADGSCFCRREPDSCRPIDARVCRDGACTACLVDGECGGASASCCDPLTGRCRRKTWESFAMSGAAPPMLDGAAVALDPVRRQVWLFGGWESTNRSGAGGEVWTHADLWLLDLSGPTPPVWERVALAGDGIPGPRQDATLVHDPLGDRLVLFGGHRDCVDLSGRCVRDASRDYSITYLGDAWTFSLPSRTWRPLGADDASTRDGGAGSPRPAPRSGHAAVYDARERRMVVFGGRGEQLHSDLWTLALDPRLDDAAASVERWRLHAPAPSEEAPSARVPGYAVDPLRGRLVIFGGLALPADGGSLVTARDVWSLSLDAIPRWTKLTSDAPVLRDAVTDRPLGAGVHDARDGVFLFMASARGNQGPLLIDATHPESRFCTTFGSESLLTDARSNEVPLYDPVDHALLVVNGAASGPAALPSSRDVAKRLFLACQRPRASAGCGL